MTKSQQLKLSSVGILALLVFTLLLGGVLWQSPWIKNLDNLGNSLLRGAITSGKTHFFSIFTNFGSAGVLLIFTALITIVLYWHHLKGLALWFSSCFLIGGGLPFLVKQLVRRERPSYRLITESGFSFPSGHASSSSVFYGLVLVLVLVYCKKNWQKFLAAFLLTGVTLLILWSRVYLGVHYPSDVLAGLSLGTGIVLLSTAFGLPWVNRQQTRKFKVTSQKS